MKGRKRDEKFNPGPPTSARGGGFYGHFPKGAARRRFRVNQAHEAAILEDTMRALNPKGRRTQ